MKKNSTMYRKNILLGFCLLIMCSCNNWLDVSPKSQVKDGDLFSSETGFKEALAGIYSMMTEEYLYGKELTFGMLGVLGQEWDSQPAAYADDKEYKYENILSSNRIDSAWVGLYNTIANTNKLLEEIDAKKSLFSGVNYEMIKGEALALRAFLHFDLLRLFGASYAEAPDKVAIPYVTAYTPEIFPQEKVSVFLDKVLEDLKSSLLYLKNDPILTGQTVSETDDNGYLVNRQVHLNYYAVTGVMARVYLYKQDYANAALCAAEVIESRRFEWVKQENLTNEQMADLTFSTEHLFALNVVTLSNRAEKYFKSGGNVFAVNEATRLEYYGSTSDYRYLYLFKNGVGASNSLYYLKKYDQLNTEGAANWPVAYRNKMPMLRLSEMYYILAECRHHTSGNVLELLNEVRIHRGIGSLSESELNNFDQLMLSEFRKEVIGEGQLFFWYKRLNSARIFRTDVDMTGKGLYKLPMPKEELENPGWVSNK